jgi:O-antigen/teichoic acid export membrane protein
MTNSNESIASSGIEGQVLLKTGSPKSILSNTVFLTGASIINTAVSLVTTSLIAKTIGPELYGRYTFGLTYIMIFSVLSNFGIESWYVREASRSRSNHALIFDILPLKMMLSLMTVAVINVSVYVLGYPKEIMSVVAVLSVGLVFQLLYDCLMAVYKAREQMHVVALFAVFFRAMTALLIVVSIYVGIGFWGIVWTFVFGNGVVFVSSLVLLRHEYGKQSFRIQVATWQRLIKEGRHFFLSALLTTTYVKINVLMLSKMGSEEQVGFFIAAVNLVESLLFIPSAFNTTIYPALSRTFKDSNEALQALYEKVTKHLVIVTVGVSAGTVMVAEYVINTIYGEAFSAAIPVLQVLIFFWVCAFFSNVQSSLLFAIHFEHAQAKIMGLACAINVVLTYLLIRIHGIVGAAIASVITEAIVVFVSFLVLWSGGLKFYPTPRLLVLIVNVAAMGLTVNYLAPINMILAIAAGGLVYLVLILPGGLLDKEEKLYIWSLFKKHPTTVHC